MILAPSRVRSRVPLAEAALKNVVDSKESGRVPGTAPPRPLSLCGVCEDQSWCWLAEGSVLEVVRLADGHRVSSWDFASPFDDEGFVSRISCVAEFRLRDSGHGRSDAASKIKLLVGVDRGEDGGLLCLFEPKRSKLEKSIVFPGGVTSCRHVSGTRDHDAPDHVLCDPLRHFFGVVAVGVVGGSVYVVDLMMDQPVDEEEALPAEIHLLSAASLAREVAAAREAAIQTGQHPAISLNNDCLVDGRFQYRRVDGRLEQTFDVPSVSVTALDFFSQSGQLAVGFSFGCFQLWKLLVPVLEFSSRMEPGLLPVVGFAFQEPENDPRNFCYLWVANSAKDEKDALETVATVSLYQMVFTRREWVPRSGFYYLELHGCGLHFDHELSSDPYNRFAPGIPPMAMGPSHIQTCKTIQDPTFSYPDHFPEDSFQDDSLCAGAKPDLSLVVFSWTALKRSSSNGNHFGKPSLNSFPLEGVSHVAYHPYHYLAIFDINRWYQAQMPNSVATPTTSTDVCSFMAFYTLGESLTPSPQPPLLSLLPPEAAPNPAGSILGPGGPFHSRLLAICVDPFTVAKFNVVDADETPLEQHFYPNSLAINITCVSSQFSRGSDLSREVLVAQGLRIDILGLQRQTLLDLQQLGPSAVAEPQAMFKQCVLAGLLTPSAAVAAGSGPPSTSSQRDALLTLVLSHGLIGFLTACATEFSSAAISPGGCTLRFLLDWAWSRVVKVKSRADAAAAPLFDWSAVGPVEPRLPIFLQQAENQLKTLASLVFSLSQQSSIPTTERGLSDLETKYSVISLLSTHLKAIQWFIHVGLLPEVSDEAPRTLRGVFAYPIKALRDSFSRRRARLKEAQKSTSYDGAVLVVDAIMNRLGVVMKEAWRRDSCDSDGLFPPPSLNALLNVYRMEGIDVSAKHSIVCYLLMDIIALEQCGGKSDSAAPSKRSSLSSDHLSQFPLVFSMSPGLVKLVQGFWCLDRGEFPQALACLESPFVRPHLLQWHHEVVLKALLFQGEKILALTYLQTHKPAILTLEDLSLQLTVFLANKMTRAALDQQRRHRCIREQQRGSNSSGSLEDMFKQCHENGVFHRLVRLQLDESEEEAMIEFVRASASGPASADCEDRTDTLEALLAYYLHRSRYAEARRLVQQKTIMTSSSTTRASSFSIHATNRDSAAGFSFSLSATQLVDAYLRTLPSPLRGLVTSEGRPESIKPIRCQVARPKPLSSVVLNPESNKASSRATLLETIMGKVEETYTSDSASPPSPFTHCTPASRLSHKLPAPSILPSGQNPLLTPLSSKRRPSLPRDADSRPQMTFLSVGTPTITETNEGGISALSFLQRIQAGAKRAASIMDDGGDSSMLETTHVTPPKQTKLMRRTAENSAVLSVLDTPPVKRLRPKSGGVLGFLGSTHSLQTPSSAGSRPGTPQSILRSRAINRLGNSNFAEDHDATSPAVGRPGGANETPSGSRIRFANLSPLETSNEEPKRSLSARELLATIRRSANRRQEDNDEEEMETMTVSDDDGESDDAANEDDEPRVSVGKIELATNSQTDVTLSLDQPVEVPSAFMVTASGTSEQPKPNLYNSTTFASCFLGETTFSLNVKDTATTSFEDVRENRGVIAESQPIAESADAETGSTEKRIDITEPVLNSYVAEVSGNRDATEFTEAVEKIDVEIVSKTAVETETVPINLAVAIAETSDVAEDKQLASFEKSVEIKDAGGYKEISLEEDIYSEDPIFLFSKPKRRSSRYKSTAFRDDPVIKRWKEEELKFRLPTPPRIRRDAKGRLRFLSKQEESPELIEKTVTVNGEVGLTSNSTTVSQVARDRKSRPTINLSRDPEYLKFKEQERRCTLEAPRIGRDEKGLLKLLAKNEKRLPSMVFNHVFEDVDEAEESMEVLENENSDDHKKSPIKTIEKENESKKLVTVDKNVISSVTVSGVSMPTPDRIIIDKEQRESVGGKEGSSSLQFEMPDRAIDVTGKMATENSIETSGPHQSAILSTETKPAPSFPAHAAADLSGPLVDETLKPIPTESLLDEMETSKERLANLIPSTTLKVDDVDVSDAESVASSTSSKASVRSTRSTRSTKGVTKLVDLEGTDSKKKRAPNVEGSSMKAVKTTTTQSDTLSGDAPANETSMEQSFLRLRHRVISGNREPPTRAATSKKTVENTDVSEAKRRETTTSPKRSANRSVRENKKEDEPKEETASGPPPSPRRKGRPPKIVINDVEMTERKPRTRATSQSSPPQIKMESKTKPSPTEPPSPPRRLRGRSPSVKTEDKTPPKVPQRRPPSPRVPSSPRTRGRKEADAQETPSTPSSRTTTGSPPKSAPPSSPPKTADEAPPVITRGRSPRKAKAPVISVETTIDVDAVTPPNPPSPSLRRSPRVGRSASGSDVTEHQRQTRSRNPSNPQSTPTRPRPRRASAKDKSRLDGSEDRPPRTRSNSALKAKNDAEDMDVTTSSFNFSAPLQASVDDHDVDTDLLETFLFSPPKSGGVRTRGRGRSPSPIETTPVTRATSSKINSTLDLLAGPVPVLDAAAAKGDAASTTRKGTTQRKKMMDRLASAGAGAGAKKATLPSLTKRTAK